MTSFYKLIFVKRIAPDLLQKDVNLLWLIVYKILHKLFNLIVWYTAEHQWCNLWILPYILGYCAETKHSMCGEERSFKFYFHFKKEGFSAYKFNIKTAVIYRFPLYQQNRSPIKILNPSRRNSTKFPIILVKWHLVVGATITWKWAD